MWQFIKDIPGGIKMGAGIVGGLATGVVTVWGLMLGPVQNNASAIDTNLRNINRMERCLDTIKADVMFLECWARAEIEGTDARSCLFLNGGN